MPERGADNLVKRNGVWYARIQVRGRDVRRSLRTSSRAEAKKRLPAVLAQAEHFRFYGEARHTWKEAVVEWASSGPELSAGTLKRYLVSLGQLRGILDDLYVDEITSRTIAQISRRPGVSNATRRRDITAVSVVLRWCVSQDWREDNPAANWDRSVIKERRDPIALPEPYDLDCVVRVAPGNFAHLIRFAQYTGMREEECASLERSQVDLRRVAITLTKTKTNRPRSVPLDERALGTLTGTPPRLGCPFIFWHPPGDRYMNVASRFAAIVKRAQARAKAEKRPAPRGFRFHDLRHWYAVDYLRRGGSIYTLQQILGHSSIKTTELYLAYLTPAEQEQAKSGTAQNPAQR
jgi:integrase/recombinase XerD